MTAAGVTICGNLGVMTEHPQTTGKPRLGWRVTSVSRTDHFGPDREAWRADARYHDMSAAGSWSVMDEPQPSCGHHAHGDTEEEAKRKVLAMCREDKEWPLMFEDVTDG
jgi:hypothetical protein